MENAIIRWTPIAHSLDLTMHRMLIALLLLCTTLPLQAAPRDVRLVVVISLDQFPYQYLERFAPAFGPNGFGYLMHKGANFSSAVYGHGTDVTGPGHAVILSGTYGDMNGIIANNWYDRLARRSIYCVEDTAVRLVGAQGTGMSPARFLGSTYGDMLRIQSGFRSRVLALSNKNRAAILMGGPLASGAYWIMDSLVVTSSWYRNDLPEWVRRFNSSGAITSFFGRTWERCRPLAAYRNLDDDDAPYEEGGNGLGRTFPHPVTGDDPRHVTASYFTAFTTSPFGAEALARLAREAVEAERLGRQGTLDLLCVSFSSTDYVGHRFGPNSHEVFDMALRMDAILADLFAFLDRTVGLTHCLIALTSDHGVSPIPEYLLRHAPRAHAGRIPGNAVLERCQRALAGLLGAPPQGSRWVEAVSDHHIYLDRTALAAVHATPESVASSLADSLMAIPEMAAVFTAAQMTGGGTMPLLQRARHSYYRPRSGDLFYILAPYVLEGTEHSGTSHGDPYDYNAHVPLLIAGPGIRPGTYTSDASPADLAPTLAALTGVEFPSGRQGRVLSEAIR